MRNAKGFFAVALVASLLAAPGAHADPSGHGPSGKVSLGALSIIAAPLASVGSDRGASVGGFELAVVGSAYVVSGVAEGVGDGVEIMLDAVGGGAKLSIRVAGKTARSIGVSTGAAVEVVSGAAGATLVASGKILAFIPNASGRALLAQSRLPAGQ